MADDIKMVLNSFKFPDLTRPKGWLPNEPGAQACWYYYLLAQQQKEKVGDSIDDQFSLMAEDPWLDKHYVQTARTVAIIYGLESPDDFLKFAAYVWAQAKELGMPLPSPEYMRPLKI